jgi:hypothetical protein
MRIPAETPSFTKISNTTRAYPQKYFIYRSAKKLL